MTLLTINMDLVSFAITLFVSIVGTLITIYLTQYFQNREKIYREGLSRLNSDLELVYRAKTVNQSKVKTDKAWFDSLILSTHEAYASFIATADYLDFKDVDELNKISLMFNSGPLDKYQSVLSIKESYTEAHNAYYAMNCLGFLDSYQTILTKSANFTKREINSNYKSNRRKFRKESIVRDVTRFNKALQNIELHFSSLKELHDLSVRDFKEDELMKLHYVFMNLKVVITYCHNEDLINELLKILKDYDIHVFSANIDTKEGIRYTEQQGNQFIQKCYSSMLELEKIYLSTGLVELKVLGKNVIVALNSDLNFSIKDHKGNDIESNVENS